MSTPSSEEKSPNEATSIEALSLPEALLLVALRDEEGRIVPSASRKLPHGLAGATLLELVRRNCIRLSGDGWTARSGNAPDDPVLAKAVEAIRNSDKPKDSVHWLRTLPKLGDGLRDELVKGLVERGVLKKKKHRFLGLVPYQLYPETDASPEGDVRERLRQMVLEGKEEDEVHSRSGGLTALLAFLEICDLTDEVFDAKERSKHRKRLDQLTEDRHVAHAISGASPEAVKALLVATSSVTASAKTTP